MGERGWALAARECTGRTLTARQPTGSAVVVAERTTVDIRDIIRPLPSQETFLDALYNKEYILFGGAAGPGKSYALRWGAVELLLWWASHGHRNVRVGLFCEDYPTLKDRHISRIHSGMVNRTDLPYEEAAEQGLLVPEFPAWLGNLKETKAEGLCYFLKPQYGGGFIALRNLDDPEKYASSEFAAIFVDELTKNLRKTFDDLRFRKRWPGIAHSPFAAGANPGSIGHAWVKQLWIDRDFSGDNERLKPDSFLFIPARVDENIHQPRSYIDTLNSLPDAMRRAMKDGDWSIFEGQVFAEWRTHLHVIDPFPIPKDWTRWRAVDYGYSAPFCCLWFARSPDKKRLVAYRELYQTELQASDQAKAIRLASGQERIWITAADPSMWQNRGHGKGDTLAAEYEMAGVTLSRANNDRLAGLNACHEALAWKEIGGRLVQPPRFQVFSTCPNFIRTVPALPYDKIRVEDVDTNAEDHPYDTWRYGVMADDVQEWKRPQAEEVYGEF